MVQLLCFETQQLYFDISGTFCFDFIRAGRGTVWMVQIDYFQDLSEKLFFACCDSPPTSQL